MTTNRIQPAYSLSTLALCALAPALLASLTTACVGGESTTVIPASARATSAPTSAAPASTPSAPSTPSDPSASASISTPVAEHATTDSNAAAAPEARSGATPKAAAGADREVGAAARPADAIDEQIAKGRALLASGKASEAQAVFEAAEKADGGKIRTRMWTLRSWLAQGRVNDTLNEIDKLDRAGAKGPDVDYLYGMAFAFQGRARLKEGGVATNTAGMAFTDAHTFLASALKADPVKYSDAFFYLAESAYQSSKFDEARAAAEKAVSLAPDDPDAQALMGKIAFQQYVAANGDEAQRAKADAFLDASIAANQRVIALCDARKAPGDAARALAAHLDLGMAHAWRRKTDDVAREFGAAIAIDPNGVDMMTLRALVDGAAFLPAIEAGLVGWKAAGGTDATTLATLQWWQGRAQYEARKYAESEATFLDVLSKTQYYNSWWYVALARYQQQKHAAAIEALRKNWEVDAANLVGSIQGNRDYGLTILDGLIAWCANNQKNLDAAFLSEVQAAVVPDWAPYWNNMGLFYRDAGDALARSKKAKDDESVRAQAKALWEKSLVAYEKSVELSPEDPNYLNDLAVVLHYNLHRDLERARALYEKSQKRAVEELARKDLSAADRGFREIAARDSKNNLKLLDEEIEKARKKTEDDKSKGGTGGEPEKKDGPAPK